jgi:hypothetical protein
MSEYWRISSAFMILFGEDKNDVYRRDESSSTSRRRRHNEKGRILHVNTAFHGDTASPAQVVLAARQRGWR